MNLEGVGEVPMEDVARDFGENDTESKELENVVAGNVSKPMDGDEFERMMGNLPIAEVAKDLGIKPETKEEKEQREYWQKLVKTKESRFAGTKQGEEEFKRDLSQGEKVA